MTLARVRGRDGPLSRRELGRGQVDALCTAAPAVDFPTPGAPPIQRLVEQR